MSRARGKRNYTEDMIQKIINLQDSYGTKRVPPEYVSKLAKELHGSEWYIGWMLRQRRKQNADKVPVSAAQLELQRSAAQLKVRKVKEAKLELNQDGTGTAHIPFKSVTFKDGVIILQL